MTPEQEAMLNPDALAWKKLYESESRYATARYEHIEKLHRSNAALRGVITKLKKRLAEAQA